MSLDKMTLAVLIGNRDFFPDQLVTEGRTEIVAVLDEMGIDYVMLDEDQTKLGAVETWQHAKECADLFKQHRDRIDGILVVLPNFGDEKGVADTIKLSGLDVPILVQAYPDDLNQFMVERRRDAFCGKISVCNNLSQYGFDYSLTSLHTSLPTSESFRVDLDRFVRVCRVVNGLRNLRLGAIGARPAAFNTVRYSEKLLQAYGMSVTTIDLSEIFSRAEKLSADHKGVKDKLAEVKAYARHDSVPPENLMLMAKMGIVISDWMKEFDLDASAIQCWTSIQENYGVNACTLMSMMSEEMMPSACEVDITGAVSMFALQQASGVPGGLVDWNNNYGDDPDRCVLFHCGNWANSFVPKNAIKTAPILGTTIGEENTYGAMAGRASAGPFTFARVSTDDDRGVIKTYTGEGQLTNDSLDTFGHRAVAQVPKLQSLMQYICRNGFEHHVAMTMGNVSDALHEAFTTYLGWENYQHS